MEHVTNAVRTAYLGYTVATFGTDGMSMVHELPKFAAIRTGNQVCVVAEGTEKAKAKLYKALELYSESEGVNVAFEGSKITPATSYRLAA